MVYKSHFHHQVKSAFTHHSAAGHHSWPSSANSFDSEGLPWKSASGDFQQTFLFFVGHAGIPNACTGVLSLRLYWKCRILRQVQLKIHRRTHSPHPNYEGQGRQCNKEKVCCSLLEFDVFSFKLLLQIQMIVWGVNNWTILEVIIVQLLHVFDRHRPRVPPFAFTIFVFTCIEHIFNCRRLRRVSYPLFFHIVIPPSTSVLVTLPKYVHGELNKVIHSKRQKLTFAHSDQEMRHALLRLLTCRVPP